MVGSREDPRLGPQNILTPQLVAHNRGIFERISEVWHVFDSLLVNTNITLNMCQAPVWGWAMSLSKSECESQLHYFLALWPWPVTHALWSSFLTLGKGDHGETTLQLLWAVNKLRATKPFYNWDVLQISTDTLSMPSIGSSFTENCNQRKTTLLMIATIYLLHTLWALSWIFHSCPDSQPVSWWL